MSRSSSLAREGGREGGREESGWYCDKPQCTSNHETERGRKRKSE